MKPCIRTMEEIEKEVSDYIKSILEKYQNSFIDFGSFTHGFGKFDNHKIDKINRFSFDIFINSKLKYYFSFDLHTSTVAYLTIWEEHKRENYIENELVLNKEFFIIYPRWNYNAYHKSDRKPVFLEKLIINKATKSEVDYDEEVLTSEEVLTFLEESEKMYDSIIEKQKSRKKKKELKEKL